MLIGVSNGALLRCRGRFSTSVRKSAVKAEQLLYRSPLFLPRRRPSCRYIYGASNERATFSDRCLELWQWLSSRKTTRTKTSLHMKHLHTCPTSHRAAVFFRLERPRMINVISGARDKFTLSLAQKTIKNASTYAYSHEYRSGDARNSPICGSSDVRMTFGRSFPSFVARWHFQNPTLLPPLGTKPTCSRSFHAFMRTERRSADRTMSCGSDDSPKAPIPLQHLAVIHTHSNVRATLACFNTEC